MRQIHSYLIRIYRREARTLAGVVEDVEQRRTAAFHSLSELGELLGGAKPFPPRPTTNAALGAAGD